METNTTITLKKPFIYAISIHPTMDENNDDKPGMIIDLLGNNNDATIHGNDVSVMDLTRDRSKATNSDLQP